MLVHVNRTCGSAVGIAAGGIIPNGACACCKPNVKSVEEDAVRIVRIHSEALVVPVLRIIAGGVLAVSECAALRTLHVSPARPAIGGSPGAELTSIGVATAAVVIPNDGLRLCVDVIWVTRRDRDFDAPELVRAATTGSIATANRIVARRAGTCVHRRTRG